MVTGVVLLSLGLSMSYMSHHPVERRSAEAKAERERFITQGLLNRGYGQRAWGFTRLFFVTRKAAISKPLLYRCMRTIKNRD